MATAYAEAVGEGEEDGEGDGDGEGAGQWQVAAPRDGDRADHERNKPRTHCPLLSMPSTRGHPTVPSVGND
jgi:hypothetical protein